MPWEYQNKAVWDAYTNRFITEREYKYRIPTFEEQQMINRGNRIIANFIWDYPLYPIRWVFSQICYGGGDEE